MTTQTLFECVAAYIAVVVIALRTIRYFRHRPKRALSSKCKVAKGGKLIGFDNKPKIMLDDFEKEIS